MVGGRLRRSNDEARFELLVREHAKAVRTYAHSIASSPTIAEDASQETFLRAWRYLDSFRGEGSREGWLIRICRHTVHDLEARERRIAPPHHVRLDHLGSGTTLGAAAATTDVSFDLLEHIGALPVAQREVLVLCGVLGYRYEAVAEILDLPVGTVRSRLHRARGALHSLLLVEDGIEPAEPPDTTDRAEPTVSPPVVGPLTPTP